MGEYPRGSNNNNADDEADEGDRTEIRMIYVIDLMSNWGGLDGGPELNGQPIIIISIRSSGGGGDCV